MATCLLLGTTDLRLCPELDGESSGGPPVLLELDFLSIVLVLCPELGGDMSGGPPVLLEVDLCNPCELFLDLVLPDTGSMRCEHFQFKLEAPQNCGGLFML